MAPTACGSAAILIDSTECRCTLVCPNSKRRLSFPEGKSAVCGAPTGPLPYFPYAARLQCSMPPCSCLFSTASDVHSPPRRGEPARRRHPAARDPRRPCGARAFRPRDAWAHPARRRSQPARGRRPVRGAVRRRRDRAKRRRLVTAARKSSARARRTEENRDKVLVRYAGAERKAERRFLTRAAEVVLCGATVRSGKRQAACRNG